MTGRIFIAIILVSIGLNSCKKEQSQIPSYVRINGIDLIDTDFLTVKNGFKTTNNLSDDWVDMNGDYIGTFQNPTRFPVLYWGTVQGQFTPGVKADGTAATREIYPFIHPYTTNLNLAAGQVLNFTPVYHYWANTVAPINDFFEDSNDYTFKTIDTTGYASYAIVHDTSEVFSGKGSLYIQLTPTRSQFELYEKTPVLLPLDQPVWLEVNFKVDMPTTIGVVANVPTSTGSVQNPTYLVDLQPTTVWKKIYIDFTSTISTNVAGTTFQFVIVGTLPSGQQTGNIYLDNLRVLTF